MKRMVRVPGGDHLVDYLPVRQSSEIAVVDKEVRLELPAEVSVRLGLLGEVLIDGVEGDPPLLTPPDRFVQQLSLTDRPED